MASVKPVRFRPVVEDDYAKICNLVSSEEELFLFYAQGKHPLTPAQVEALVQKRKDSTVMLCDGQVAGFSNFYGFKRGKSACIGNVIIAQSLRGKGLGRQLASHMLNVAFVKHGLPMVKAHVFNRNVPSLSMCAALGFKPYAMKMKKDFKGKPVVQFSLRLKRGASPD